MKKIQRPKDIARVSIMMHLAQYFLTQVVEILGYILIAPADATPSPIYERAETALKHAEEALRQLEGEE